MPSGDPITDISDGMDPATLPPPQRGALASSDAVMLSPAPRDGPMLHLVVKRHTTMLRLSFEVSSACTMANGMQVPLKPLANVQRCLQKMHASLKIYEAAAPLANATDGRLIGKLRSNSKFTEYDLFSPFASAAVPADAVLDDKGRRHVGKVCYSMANVGKGKGTPSAKNTPAEVSYTLVGGEGEELVLRSINPVWDPTIKSFKIDYGDRKHSSKAVIASSKNMRLEHNGVKVMDFFKVDKDTFSLEYCWPLTGMQALCAALTKFDTRSFG